jgi:hypothetical protein
MLNTVIAYLRKKTGLDKVVFCLWGIDAYAVFERELQQQIK